MPFQIIRDDITRVKADAIVNTANPDVAIGGGVDSAIYKAAGEKELLEARRKIGILRPGEVGITRAFNLDARYIIHVSGPWWQGGDHCESELLKQCYDRALALAAKKRCKSIAFPLLATGTYGFPKKLGMEIAVDSFTGFLEEHEMNIYLVVFGSTSVKISGELALDVRHFIDDKYVDKKLKQEYCFGNAPRAGAHHAAPANFAVPANSIRPQERDYNNMVGASYPEASMSMPQASMPMPKVGLSLDDTLKGMYTDSFEKHLQQLINKKGFKNSDVYAAANISKQYFSKLLKGQVKPSKEKVLALAVGLQLNMDEAVDFLRLAGYALSPVSQTDVIVEYFIRHKDYNVMKIDIVLFDYGLDPLSQAH